jgi:hypothetical protein
MATALNHEAARSRLDLTRWLLRAAGLPEVADKLRDDQPVLPMDDGGMGSFALVLLPGGGSPVGEATYEDDDGVEVRITLFVDENNEPVQVDFWKVDFAPLISFPSHNQLRGAGPVSQSG